MVPKPSFLQLRSDAQLRSDMAELTHVGGGVWLTPAGVELREGHHGGQRLHQHPNDPEGFLTSDELAELFVALNENEFELEQVDREVLSALWQLSLIHI